MFTLVGEKVGLVTLDDDYIEELVPIRTYHVPHSFIYNAERTVGDEEQLFFMGHQVAQDHKCFIPSQDVLLHVLLNPLVQEASIISL